MKVFCTDINVCASLYVLAETEEEALAAAKAAIIDGALEFSSNRQCVGDDIYMTGEVFHSDMPAISLSPAMTILPLDKQTLHMEVADELDEDDEDGQDRESYTDDQDRESYTA